MPDVNVGSTIRYRANDRDLWTVVGCVRPADRAYYQRLVDQGYRVEVAHFAPLAVPRPEPPLADEQIALDAAAYMAAHMGQPAVTREPAGYDHCEDCGRPWKRNHTCCS